MWGVGAFACSFVSACLFLVQFLHRSLLILPLGVNGKLAARLSRSLDGALEVSCPVVFRLQALTLCVATR